MSRARPRVEGTHLPNIVVELRETYLALNAIVIRRLTTHGHSAIRPAHAAVFQYLDVTGTTVSTLAERAEMTKQAMAELVNYLEQHGYVRRVPDPSDGRAKLVLPTERGHEVIKIAQGLITEVEKHVADTIRADRLDELRRDLRAIYRATVEIYGGETRQRPRTGQ